MNSGTICGQAGSRGEQGPEFGFAGPSGHVSGGVDGFGACRSQIFVGRVRSAAPGPGDRFETLRWPERPHNRTEPMDDSLVSFMNIPSPLAGWNPQLTGVEFKSELYRHPCRGKTMKLLRRLPLSLLVLSPLALPRPSSRPGAAGAPVAATAQEGAAPSYPGIADVIPRLSSLTEAAGSAQARVTDSRSKVPSQPLLLQARERQEGPGPARLQQLGIRPVGVSKGFWISVAPWPISATA